MIPIVPAQEETAAPKKKDCSGGKIDGGKV